MTKERSTEEQTQGLTCPRCESKEFRVERTDRGVNKIKRRRRCVKCGYRIVTWEQLRGDIPG